MRMSLTRRRVTLLFSLYFCQGLPGGFLAVALPVILREHGLSLATVGIAAWLSLPWVLKIFWAPLADRVRGGRLGRRTKWILPAQIGMILVTLSFAFLDPESHLFEIALLFLVLNFFAATQDIGVDGLAVDILRKEDLGPGNAAQVAGFKLGNLFGGGVLLAASGLLGWRGVFMIMGAVVTLAMVLLLLMDEKTLVVEPVEAPAAHHEGVLRVLWKAVRGLGPAFWLFLVFAKFGETFGGAMVKPMLVDHGFSRALIGILDGTVGSISTIVGGILAGLVYRKWGWRPALSIFSVLQGLALAAFGLYSVGEVTPLGAGVLNGLENLAGGGVGVAIFALAMSVSRRRVGASHFTACQVVYMSGSFLAYPLSGLIADRVGYLPVMVGGGVMAVMVGGLALWGLKRAARFAGGTIISA
jgi:PAT family beta-lactamase induction signal transducer AmpG